MSNLLSKVKFVHIRYLDSNIIFVGIVGCAWRILPLEFGPSTLDWRLPLWLLCRSGFRRVHRTCRASHPFSVQPVPRSPLPQRIQVGSIKTPISLVLITPQYRGRACIIFAIVTQVYILNVPLHFLTPFSLATLSSRFQMVPKSSILMVPRRPDWYVSFLPAINDSSKQNTS